MLRNVIVGEPPIPPFYCWRDPMLRNVIMGEFLCYVMLLWESPLSPILLWESVGELLCYVMLLWESSLSPHVMAGECGSAPMLRNVIVREPIIPPCYCWRVWESSYAT